MNITTGYWETRDGRKARVLCTDAPGKCPVKGYIEHVDGDSSAYSWDINGFWILPNDTNADLIRPWIDRPAIDWSKEREWVKAVAGDEDGQWVRYSGIPELGDGEWSPNGNEFQWMHPSEHPQFTGDWKDSLCVRPEVEGGSK